MAAIRGINLAGVRLTDEQRTFVEGLVSAHVALSGGSKALTQQDRDVLADWKHSLSFWGQLKEAKYPIVSARSEGARFWDIDGNAYIDVAMGMGVHFFGHKPAFIHAALARQMAAGLELGTQCPLTGEAARLLCEITGNERVAFSNTGSEVVMVGLRIARAATGRNTVVIFKESYHGIFDGVLATLEGGARVPVGIGTTPGMIEDLVVLEYGADASLDYIQRHGPALAAVLVEPVQSRNPDLQPQGFLKKLRRITRASGTALIFDEMINGFRILPGGAQAWFGVDADMALYGKIVGGGMPIGVIAGKAKFLDYIDGGAWDYGDRSGPGSAMIYFGGTFCRNPATMVATHAALSHIKAMGPALQETATARTTAFCDRLNLWFERERVPLRAKHFSSQWRLVPVGDKDMQPIEMELLYLRMMDRGVYTWERRISFFSTAHGQAEVDAVFEAVTGSIRDIRAGGFAWSVERYPKPQFGQVPSVQRRLFALAQRPGGELPYHLPQAFWVDGPLDADRLEDAFRAIIQRHISLRTGFLMLDGQLVAKRVAEPRFAVERTAAAAGEIDSVVARFLRPFDLSQPPLLRVAVATLAPDRHLLIADAHHIVVDGLSFNIIAAELMALYAGQALPPVGYDLERCQTLAEAAAQGERGQANAAFWRAELAGELPRLDLPADRPRPPTRGFQGDTVALSVPVETTRRLKALGRPAGASLYLVLLAAWSGYLHRLTGQDDILIGGAASGRDNRELAEAVGMFVNTVAFRTRPQAGLAFRQHLAAVRQTALAVYDHQDYPFEAIAALAGPSAPNRNPVFDTMLSYENASERVFNIEALTFTQHELRLPTAMFDLGLDVVEAHETLALSFGFSTELFERRSVERWAQGFERFLHGILDDPDQPIGRLPVMTEADIQQLQAWNQTAASYPHGQTVVDWFERQVEQTPDNTALVFEGQRMSYAELNAKANQLAHHLRGLNTPGGEPLLGENPLVAIAAERSFDLVVGLLGILKAGGAYVPVDPGYPPARIRYMLEDSAAPVLLTQSHLTEGLALGELAHRCLALCLDELALPSQSAENPTSRSGPEDLAYVIYTSGSTGKPKGTLLTHQGLGNYLHWAVGYYAVAAGNGAPVQSSIAFDATITSVYLPLIAGKPVVLLPEHEEIEALAATLRQAPRYSLVKITPAHLEMLNHQLSRTEYSSASRALVIGGEALSSAHIKPWLSYAPDTHLINEYGPTETVVGCCIYDAKGQTARDGAIPIGKPIANTRIHILSGQGQPQPIGVPGELCIAGAGLARGYLNRPELTAEKFVETEVFGAPERIYRTGDLARWLPDGNLEYLGRLDEQVKLRGFRIELGEIEAALAQHPSIQEAVVLLYRGDNNPRLVAYLVASGQAVDGYADQRALAAFLKSRLPDYMVPSAFVALDSLPLTPNGKVDRKALPAPGEDALAAQAYVPPLGVVEETLATIWATLLGRERIGRYDNFFELGGHSLLAVDLIERMRRADLSAVDIRALFAAPTLAGLAAACGGGGAEVEVPPNRIPPGCTAITPDMLPLVALAQEDIDRIVQSVPGGAANVQDIYPLAPLQEGILFHHRLQAEGDAYLLAALLAFDTRARLDGFFDTLHSAIARHDALRTAAVWDGLPEPVQVVWRVATLAVEEVNLAGAADAVATLRGHFDPRRQRLDLSQAPLMRAFVGFDAAQDRWLLLWVFHHLTGDHTTLEVLAEEFQTRQAGRALPPPVPYRNYIAQAKFGVTAEEHEAFFSQMLADINEPTAPYGLVDVQGGGADIEEYWLRLDDSVSQRLRGQAQRLGSSAASLFHLAFARVLSALTGRESPVFGTVLFGRMQGGAGADRALGLFINTLPLRVDITRDSVEAAVRRVHQTLAGLLRHEHAPLALAQRLSGVAPPAPLFTALLNYRHSSENHAAWEGITELEAKERTNYPLGVSVDDLGAGFALTVQAVPLIGAARLAAYFKQTLESLADALEQAPATPACALAVLPEAERRQVLQSWNAGVAYDTQNLSIHGLFEAQAAKTPNATALAFAGETLSYAELNARANQLARHLLTLKAADGTALWVGNPLIAIAAERSFDLIVGLLGILKAGGAYVPIDPAYPAARARHMLEDSAAPVLLAQRQLQTALGLDNPPPGCRVLWLDTLDLSGRPDTNPAAQCGPNDLAYVIYTSGSTGKPKGCQITHCNVTRLFAATDAYYRFNAEDVWTLFHSSAFDFSVWEIWGALLYGGKLVVVPYLTSRSPEDFYQLLISQKVTVLNQTPSAFKQLIDVDAQPCDLALRLVIFGGEALNFALLQPWFEAHGDQHPQLVNMYGITETTVHVTYYPLAKGQSQAGSVIGKPIPDLGVWILDANQQPVPVGVPGEIIVGGAGVARGYLNRPELTAERFIELQLLGTAERVYRSGDLARWLPDGNLEYLGRIDEQVKLRGFRIELGEIESALAQHDSVSAAVVSLRQADSNTQLVAHVVLTGSKTTAEGAALGSADLHAALSTYLKSRLPDYMVPSAFVALDKLPLTANGKVDRKALPAPEFESTATSASAPATPTEDLLAALWAGVLKREAIGREDDFFALGGHSLLATQLAARIRETFKTEVPIRAVFEHSRLCDLADAIDAAAGAVRLPPIEAQPDGSPQVLSFAQQRLWFLSQLEGQAATYNMPAALRLSGQLDIEALRQSLHWLLERHESLRSRFPVEDGQASRYVLPMATFSVLQIHDLRQLAPEAARQEAQALARAHALAPFDLATGPLLKADLLRLGEEEAMLLLNTHHIASDGWSVGVLVRDWRHAYAAFSQGRPPSLPPLAIQYSDYAIWQRQWLQGETLQRQLDYWATKLAGLPELLELPTDRPRPPRQSYRGAQHAHALPTKLS
ncbi:MAG: amino acid adenylation domain-containing protein, partial [Candidatus Methylumidiphilus sp.]